MKISIGSLTTWLAIIVLSSCGPRPYFNKQFRIQKVPDNLKSRTWTLQQISIGAAQDSAYKESYRLYDPHSCPFIFQFADKGKLITDFKSNKLYGTFLIDGSEFKYLHFGWIMKIVWTANPECKITPTELSYVFKGSFQFKIEGETLILKNQRGDRFILTANI